MFMISSAKLFHLFGKFCVLQIELGLAIQLWLSKIMESVRFRVSVRIFNVKMMYRCVANVAIIHTAAMCPSSAYLFGTDQPSVVY